MKKKLNFILLNGPMGSGKSSIAGILRRKLKRTAMLSIEDVRGLLSDFKPSSEDHLLAWNVIYRMCDEYFRNGISVLLEQTVASKEIVSKFLRLAKKHKCDIHFYHLKIPKKILLERISSRIKDRKAQKSLVMSNIRKHEEVTYPEAIILDTSKLNIAKTAKVTLNQTGSPLSPWLRRTR